MRQQVEDLAKTAVTEEDVLEVCICKDVAWRYYEEANEVRKTSFDEGETANEERK